MYLKMKRRALGFTNLIKIIVLKRILNKLIARIKEVVNLIVLKTKALWCAIRIKYIIQKRLNQ
jgi:hypothetical protein